MGTVTVNLENNNNNLRVGAQYEPADTQDHATFYYKGNIGKLALYNRPLTANEIQQNYQTYSA